MTKGLPLCHILLELQEVNPAYSCDIGVTTLTAATTPKSKSTAAALSPFSKTGLTDIQDIVPWIRFLVSGGWWMTGQTILVNGGYTTK